MQPRDGSGVGYLGLGVYLPEQIRTNDWWPEDWRREHGQRLKGDVIGSVEEAVARRSPEVDALVVRHAFPYSTDLFRGTKERRVIPEGMGSAEMEAAACRAALGDAGIEPEHVDLLLGHSTVRDYVASSNHGLVAHQVGLRPSVTAFEVCAGCVSFFLQLRVAVRQIQSGENDVALTYVSSAISRITDYTRPASIGIGDGAVAGVIGRVEPGFGYIAQTTLTRGDLHGAIQLAPRDHPDVPWYRFDLYDEPLVVRRIDDAAAHMLGTQATSFCRETCEALFAKTGYGPEDIDFFIVSQAAAWFPYAMCESLGIDTSKCLAPPDHYQKYAHLMDASAPLNLHLARQYGRLAKGDLVLVYTPGVGVSTAATLYRWNLDA